MIDTTMEDNLMTAALKAMVLFALGIWAALLLVVYLLSGWAVKPMARAWDMQRQFVADASHDLKTPLTVILSNTELLKQQTEGAESPEVDRIQSAGKRMKDLVQKGSQFLISSHSPILTAYPDAVIWELRDTGMRRTQWRETENYILTKRFLADPSYFLDLD